MGRALSAGGLLDLRKRLDTSRDRTHRQLFGRWAAGSAADDQGRSASYVPDALTPCPQGKLYSRVDSTSSMWQLEPPNSRSRLSARERTNSTTSTASTHSSYAFISDPEISSSFAASLESGPVSDSEDPASPLGFASPNFSSGDEGAYRRIGSSHPVSRSVSPGHALRSLTSSYSSLESLHSHRSGRLLTLHLEKQQSIIWPSLIVGPVPDKLSPHITNSVVFDASDELEHQYNMDPTSLILIALDFLDIRKNKEDAFEYFL